MNKQQNLPAIFYIGMVLNGIVYLLFQGVDPSSPIFCFFQAFSLALLLAGVYVFHLKRTDRYVTLKARKKKVFSFHK